MLSFYPPLAKKVPLEILCKVLFKLKAYISSYFTIIVINNFGNNSYYKYQIELLYNIFILQQLILFNLINIDYHFTQH